MYPSSPTSTSKRVSIGRGMRDSAPNSPIRQAALVTTRSHKNSSLSRSVLPIHTVVVSQPIMHRVHCDVVVDERDSDSKTSIRPVSTSRLVPARGLPCAPDSISGFKQSGPCSLLPHAMESIATGQPSTDDDDVVIEACGVSDGTHDGQCV